VGGMYDYFFMHFEEIDLCWKFHRARYKVYCHSNSKVYHVGGGSLSYQSPQKTYYNFRNNLVMVWRNSGTFYKLYWLPLRLFLDGGASLRYLAKGDVKNFLSVVKGYLGFLYWILFVKDNNNILNNRLNLNSFRLLKVKSIVFKYYFGGKKKYSMI
jgi:GT2 family glycosyltransferase